MAENRSVVVTDEQLQPVTLDERSITSVAQNVKMAEKMVMSILEREIDYGQTPGTQGMGLWDAGASKVMAAFNCYPDHQVLFQTEEENLISWCIQVQLISRQTQQIVGCGIGAASTKETKYKYRWVPDPQNYGYNDEEIAKFKTREKRPGVVEYRILNPEYGELVNTLFQMAAKRAEVDAARGMPGVASALKKLFLGKIKPEEGDGDITMGQFWGYCNNLGIEEGAVHSILGVESVNDWIKQGKTLRAAKQKIAASIANARTKAGEKREPKERTEESIKTATDLLVVCNEDWSMQPADVWKELGYSTQRDFETAGPTPWEAYLNIKENKKEPEKQEDIPF